MEKLRNFQFPGESKKLAVSAPRQPKPAELEWLAKYDRRPQGASAVGKAVEVKAQLFSGLDPGSILQEFGIETAEELAWWSQMAATAHKEKEQEDEPASSDGDW